MKRFFKSSYFAIVIAFIYIPILVMIGFSFNSGETTASWVNFSFDWYSKFFNNSPFIKSIITSLFVAVVSTVISVVIGTMAAIGLSRTKKVTQKSWFGIANLPLINADVVTAVSLMIVFLMAGLKFGIVTLILAHISFNVPYVLITVMPRLRKIDKSLIEASYDLGAKNTQVLFKVILPILKPAIITATAIAFAMSFDDFIISYFTGGDQINVSSFIYTAKKIKPYVFAFGTILVLVIVLAIIGWNAVTMTKQHRLEVKQKIKNGSYKNSKIQKLRKSLNELIINTETQTEITRTWRISLWARYYFLKFKIWLASSQQYDKRISRLEWKQYKLRSEINKEKRYYSRLTKAEKKAQNLEKQLLLTKADVKKAAKLTIQIEKLEIKIAFLRDEIEWIEHRDEVAEKKAAKITKEIRAYQKDLKAEINPSKKTLAWYAKKIKELEDWKIEVEEGKNHYRLRMVVEQLKELKQKNASYILELNDKLQIFHAVVYSRKSITAKFDKQIRHANSQEKENFLLEKRAAYLEMKTTKYEQRILNKEVYIQKVQAHIEQTKEKFFPSNPDTISHSKGFLARSWKIILVAFIGTSAFAGLTVAYVMNNIYDLVVANWGEYIDPALIGEFEKANNVKINYQEYDSNETLYNKLYTFNYDVMVPSDYMVQKMSEEGRLMKLDYSKLNVRGTVNNGELNPTPESTKEESKRREIESSLLDVMYQSKVKETEHNQATWVNNLEKNEAIAGSILEYALPYFWGDLVIVVNPTPDNVNFLKDNGVQLNDKGQIDNNTLSWDILWKAAAAKKRVALNSDPKNIFAAAAQVQFQKVNLDTNAEIDQVKDKVTELVQSKSVSLNGDDLINKVALGFFDFAMMYNGDAAFANAVYNGDAELDDEETLKEQKDSQKDNEFVSYIYGRPNAETNGRKEGTNVFSDNVVISTDTRNVELSYKFLNFLFEKSTHLTDYAGITSPFVESMEEMVSEEGTYRNYENLYKPITVQKDAGYDPADKKLAFQYHGRVDDYLVDKYNSIVAGKR
ncbi:spermidine/putrescine ABC transporter permease [Mesoplasma syrphidae]|uniref:Spermidine/putrescine ABC transporter permease n=1 Tax=Mesoplasma syrphidae TaxID=225999 RepID=A0A2K9C2U0_9MOLU|nr:spermidine/putrescine ABC transporter permease/substrate-binding protein [Mesoplasma syrphidae]AUF83789.1 spermidine/putrescine ABC transporter permease [Mesoplasma syrphidae]